VKDQNTPEEARPHFYKANKYYLGIKSFATGADKTAWENELNNKTGLEAIDFDSITLCKTDSFEAAKKDARILVSGPTEGS